jgi:hypothetical protein
MIFDCENIVNIDECCLYHCECNGCMECADYKPTPTWEEMCNQGENE